MKQDPLALAFFGAALALLAALLLYVGFFKKPAPVPLPAKYAPPAATAAPAAQSPAPQASRAPDLPLQPGRTWRYAVVVQPEGWQDATLTYRTQQESEGVGVVTDFVHTGGKSNFHLGIFAHGHPSHANTRFPGFFMYPAYLKEPMRVGDPVVFSWPWQGKSATSVKRFEGMVWAVEDVQVPAGKMRATKIEGTLSYLEDGQFRERAHLIFWYASSVSQIIKIRRSGITSEERSRQIEAELVEYR